jgi:hypothetical protein
MLRACDVNWTNILVDASCFLKADIQTSFTLLYIS